jgi:hypothetical protein
MPSFIVRSPAETALDYCELGLAVVPVGKDCKPITAHGWKDASTDRARIHALWAVRPFANVAMATGTPSGVFVLDVDAKNGKDGFATLAALEALHGPVPRTWRSRTPSGGAHFLFVHPNGTTLRNRVNLPVDGFSSSGLDVRATGGLAVLPPSHKTSGLYEWEVDPLDAPLATAPAWLLELAPPRQIKLERPCAPRGALRHRPGTAQPGTSAPSSTASAMSSQAWRRVRAETISSSARAHAWASSSALAPSPSA